MTVADIKEYIDKNEQPIITETDINKLQISTLAILNTIKVMLDKLKENNE